MLIAGSAVMTKDSQSSGSLKVPYVCLHRNRDSIMLQFSSYDCSNSTWKDSTNELSLLLPFESTRTETGPVNSLELTVIDKVRMPDDRVGLT